ncbi:hypothetical protein MELB17_21270 [Marinobacter sp. ELB17]|nr:hypothetical protein MELB17_21270 [Marinobacter sp. ELB17]
MVPKRRAVLSIVNQLNVNLGLMAQPMPYGFEGFRGGVVALKKATVVSDGVVVGIAGYF